MHKDKQTKNISIKCVHTKNTLKGIIALFSRAFEQLYNVSDRYLLDMVKQKNMIALAAYENKNIVGGLIAFEILPIHGKKEIYIYDIAVDPNYQKQGIGTKLIEYLKVEAQNREVRTIFVEAESEDKDAIGFYRALGGEEIKVNHFNFDIN